MQAIISNLAISLGKLIDELQHSNQLGSETSALNSIQKQQLIVTLEAALVALKAPAVNAEQTGGVLRWLGRIFRRGSEKAIEKGVNEALGAVISEGTEFIEELGPVEIHRVRIIVAPMWIMASKLVSVLQARIAIRLNSLSF